MFHLIFNSPVETSVLDRLAENDDVLFLNDAVLCVLAGGRIADFLREKADSIGFYVLDEDMAARGIAPKQLAPNINIVDYPEFVRLAAANALIQSWC